MDATAEFTFTSTHHLVTPMADPAVAAVAAELHERAFKEDTALSQDVFGAVDQIGATHRERRIKSMSSLARKIARHPELGTYAAAAAVSNTLSYYVVFDAPVFESRYHATLMALARQGHRVNDQRSYLNDSNRHEGSRVRMLSRNGMPFEIQFHTRTSLSAKRLSDALCAMLRDPSETSARRLWAEDQCRQIMGQIPLPAEINLLGMPEPRSHRS